MPCYCRTGLSIEGLDILESYKLSYKEKLAFIEKLVDSLQEEILHAPFASDKEEDDTITARQFQHKKAHQDIETAMNAYIS